MGGRSGPSWVSVVFLLVPGVGDTRTGRWPSSCLPTVGWEWGSANMGARMVSIQGGRGETEASVSEFWTGETVCNPRRAALIKNPLRHGGGLGLGPEGPWARG